MWYNRVETVGGQYMDTPSGGNYEGQLSLSFLPVTCQHCIDAPCVAQCPSGASYKDEYGFVQVDNTACLGCKTCFTACPYDVRQFNETEPEYYLDFALGDWDAPTHVSGTTEKCTFCANRIGRGEKPACMLLCPARARFWGDIDDPASEVSKYLEGKETYFLLEEQGTIPSCYYI